MPTVSTARLVQFSSKLDQKLADAGVQFARKEDENSGVKTAGKVAGAGALAAGALYARGRMAAGKGAPHVGIRETIKGGAQAVKGDVGLLAAKTGALAAKGGTVLNQAGRNALAASMKAAKSARGLLSREGKVKALARASGIKA